MEELTPGKKVILEALDEQIDRLEKRLAKVQPLIEELNKYRQTRRVLLDEKGTTGGGGNSNVRISQESVILYLKENPGSKPQDIADSLGVKAANIRSHLARGKDERYDLGQDGLWRLIEDAPNGDGDEDE